MIVDRLKPIQLNYMWSYQKSLALKERSVCAETYSAFSFLKNLPSKNAGTFILLLLYTKRLKGLSTGNTRI
jgi:hypothetical protein